MAKTQAQLEIQKLNTQKRKIDKEIKLLKSTVNNTDKLDAWKAVDEIKRRVKKELGATDLKWKKFVDTPDWFNYAYYKKVGNTKRLVTSFDKPNSNETKTDEATMIKLAQEHQAKLVKTKRKTTRIKTKTASTGKNYSIANKNIS